MANCPTHGTLITFEGGEGSGKSTQANLLATRLRTQGRSVTLTREPAGSPLGQIIKRVLDDNSIDPEPMAELLLFEAARVHNVSDVIRPALERGETVICDRFVDSSLAYQGYGRGMDPNVVREISQRAIGNLTPHLTIILDIDPKHGLARARTRSSSAASDRIGERPLEYHRRVRDGYLTLAQREPQRFFVADADQRVGPLADLIWERVRSLFAFP